MENKQPIRQKVKLFLSLVLAGLLCSLSSCKKTESASFDGKVGVLFPSEIYSARWEDERVSLTKALEEKGFQVYSYPIKSTGEVVSYLEEFEKEGLNALIIASVNTLSAKIATALEALHAKKTYIVCYDRLQQNTDAVDLFISASSYRAGEILADALFVQQLPKSSTVEIIGGDALDKNAKEIYDGIWSKISLKIHSGEWKVPSGKTSFELTALDAWSKDVAAKRFIDILDTYYKKGELPDAIITASDVIAQGIVSVLDEMNIAVEKYPLITGQDNTTESRELVKAGKQTMTINKNPEKYIEATVAAIENVVENNAVESSTLVNNGAKQVPVIQIEVTPVYKPDIQ